MAQNVHHNHQSLLCDNYIMCVCIHSQILPIKRGGEHKLSWYWLSFINFLNDRSSSVSPPVPELYIARIAVIPHDNFLLTQDSVQVWCTSINIIFTQTHHSHHFTSSLQHLLTFVKIAMVMEFNQVFLLQLLIVQVQFIHTVYLPSFECWIIYLNNEI